MQQGNCLITYAMSAVYHILFAAVCLFCDNVNCTKETTSTYDLNVYEYVGVLGIGIFISHSYS